MIHKEINGGFWIATEGTNKRIDAKTIALYLHSIPEDICPQQKHAKLKGLRMVSVTVK